MRDSRATRGAMTEPNPTDITDPTNSPTDAFFLIVADHDTGLFCIEGPMTDDAPWNLAAGRARENGRQVQCGPSGPDRAALAEDFQRTSQDGRRSAGQHRQATRMSDQLPAIIEPAEPGALTPLPAGHLVPALIADAGEQAGWRYVEFFTANIRNPNTRRAYARACRPFFAWCDERGLTLDDDPAVRRRHLYRDAAADPFGAGREAAARRGAHAVRLADHRPGGADQPGRGRARAEARGEDRQDAGAGCQGVAQAARQHPDRRPCAICATAR